MKQTNYIIIQSEKKRPQDYYFGFFQEYKQYDCIQIKQEVSNHRFNQMLEIRLMFNEFIDTVEIK